MANKRKYLPEHHNLITTILRILASFLGLIIISMTYTIFYENDVSPIILSLIIVYPGIILTRESVRKIKVGKKNNSSKNLKNIIRPKKYLSEGWYRLALTLWFILPLIFGFLFALDDEEVGFFIAIFLFILHWPIIYLFKWIKDGFKEK